MLHADQCVPLIDAPGGCSFIIAKSKTTQQSRYFVACQEIAALCQRRKIPFVMLALLDPGIEAVVIFLTHQRIWTPLYISMKIDITGTILNG